MITSTTNPETFFDRYELYFKKLVCLAEAEQRKLIHLDGDSPSEALKKFDTDSVRISMINDFIDRMWKDCCKHADSLKTERGKTNAINRFYSTLAKYNERMYQSNIDYYTSKKYPIFRG